MNREIKSSVHAYTSTQPLVPMYACTDSFEFALIFYRRSRWPDLKKAGWNSSLVIFVKIITHQRMDYTRWWFAEPCTRFTNRWRNLRFQWRSYEIVKWVAASCDLGFMAEKLSGNHRPPNLHHTVKLLCGTTNKIHQKARKTSWNPIWETRSRHTLCARG